MNDPRSPFPRILRSGSSGLGTAIAVSLLLAVSACGPDRTDEAPATDTETGSELLETASEAARVIDADALREPIEVLASDELGGRAPGSEGDEKARELLVERLEALGLEPGGPDGSWMQPFEIVGITAEAPESWTFRGDDRSLALDWREEFIAASGVAEPAASIEDAEVVFVGYGIQAPEYDWDDYGDADLEGKVLLMLNNDPEWDPDLFEGERRLYYGRWTYKYESAAAQGAAGAIIVHTTPSAGYPFQVVQTSWTGEQFELPAPDEERLQIEAWLSRDASRELVELAGMDLDELVERARSREFEPIPLDVKTSLRLENRVRRVETANVLGLLPGSHPERSDEVVIYTAHHDHLGTAEPGDVDGDDLIYNGALDNASGTSQVLSIARAFRALPEAPDRSVLFAFVGAEEQGLLGSQHYAAHPTFPPGKIAAVINVDGGNIWGATKDVTFIGHEKSDLGPLVERYAAEQGRVVRPDQFPDRGYYYRSDQLSLARIGVPGIYLDTGLDFRDRPEDWGKQQIEAWEQEHYHQPSDELTDEWSFEGMVEDARLMFHVGLDIAESEEMPGWTPGDEFEAIREQALERVASEESAP